jgi:hypothetical protein
MSSQAYVTHRQCYAGHHIMPSDPCNFSIPTGTGLLAQGCLHCAAPRDLHRHVSMYEGANQRFHWSDQGWNVGILQ